jgi:hypothetical protein
MNIADYLSLFLAAANPPDWHASGCHCRRARHNRKDITVSDPFDRIDNDGDYEPSYCSVRVLKTYDSWPMVVPVKTEVLSPTPHGVEAAICWF